MNILVVGAGALGQPFGYHLSAGGADVSYLVKPKYREEMEQGLRLHRHRVLGGPVSHDFDDYGIFTDAEATAERDWDQLWLCVSSPAIRGEWIEELLDIARPDTLVSIQPGLDDREYLESRYPAEQIVSGRVAMVAYPAPLPGDELPEGDIAYFMPPAEKIYFGDGRHGPTNDNHDMSRARSTAKALKSGGLPAGTRTDILPYTAFGGALLQMTVAGLEVAGWSLRQFRRTEAIDLAMQATREAFGVVSQKFDASPPLSLRMASAGWPLKMGLPIATAASPFDLEAYLQEHFTKVGEQTRIELRRFAEAAEATQQPSEALRALHQGLA